MDAIKNTAPPACASPDGALPLSAPTPAAGAQTGRVVEVCDVRWPRDARDIGEAVVLLDGDGEWQLIVEVCLDDAAYVGPSPGRPSVVAPYATDYRFAGALGGHRRVTEADMFAADAAIMRAWDAAQEVAS